jgi:hypothetical protein
MAMFYDKRLGKVIRGGRRRLYSQCDVGQVHSINRTGPGQPAKRRVVKIHWIIE